MSPWDIELILGAVYWLLHLPFCVGEAKQRPGRVTVFSWCRVVATRPQLTQGAWQSTIPETSCDSLVLRFPDSQPVGCSMYQNWCHGTWRISHILNKNRQRPSTNKPFPKMFVWQLLVLHTNHKHKQRKPKTFVKLVCLIGSCEKPSGRSKNICWTSWQIRMHNGLVDHYQPLFEPTLVQMVDNWTNNGYQMDPWLVQQLLT